MMINPSTGYNIMSVPEQHLDKLKAGSLNQPPPTPDAKQAQAIQNQQAGKTAQGDYTFSTFA
ncbi:MAG: hypothetical protein HXX11_14635 [Desulfuromonadales bacterium]|nr:hypothetical protein [Desulfuromonadales bacterium]